MFTDFRINLKIKVVKKSILILFLTIVTLCAVCQMPAKDLAKKFWSSQKKIEIISQEENVYLFKVDTSYFAISYGKSMDENMAEDKATMNFGAWLQEKSERPRARVTGTFPKDQKLFKIGETYFSYIEYDLANINIDGEKLDVKSLLK